MHIENQVLDKETLEILQYGDKVTIDRMEVLGDTTSAYEANMFY
jgi:hypothetical protein